MFKTPEQQALEEYRIKKEIENAPQFVKDRVFELKLEKQDLDNETKIALWIGIPLLVGFFAPWLFIMPIIAGAWWIFKKIFKSWRWHIVALSVILLVVNNNLFSDNTNGTTLGMNIL